MTKLKLFVLSTIALFGVSAHAELSPEVAATMTAIQTDGLALVDLAWPVIGAIVGAFVIFKLFKRAARQV